MKYLTRPKQREYLQEQHNIELGESALENKAYKGVGPREVMINGRALSTAEWLDEWVQRQAAQPLVRRRRGKVAAESPAA